jgi:hypothetical protein
MTDDDLFEQGDPFEDRVWKEEESPKQKPKRSLSARYVGCPLEWLQWVVPRTKSKQQLLVALYLYRRCHVCHSRTVDVPTRDLAENWGISRTTKYRVLGHLEQAGVVAVWSRNGRTIKVTLSHWPDPPVMSVWSAS